MDRRFVEAALYAARAHSGQRRKGGDVPYINHPLEVAAAVAMVTSDPDTVCAAVLHDVVEDTATTLGDIAERFGGTVARLVAELTDRPEWASLPTPERKRRQAAEFRGASAAAQTIKIADQWSNVAELAARDSGKDAAELQAFLDAARETVAVCRGACPDLAGRFEDAAAALERCIARMQS